MTDLTDKLNAGRLYYVKKKNGKIVIRQAHLYSCLITEKATPYVDFDDNDIEKVLAPVPSYNEVQSLEADRLAKNEGEEIVSELKQKIHILTESQMKLENTIGELGEENARLKGLLKECYTVVDTRMLNLRGLYNTDNLEVYKRESERLKELLTKIEEVLK